ncbi:glycosyltransferase family 4 protein [Microcoleus sp. FACHB-831]|uniref:glycosyltransferase family 4 protein n=1 Tax=Microcoleus sp. FACHB-831 TaxID=2692827 RepID=UPI00168A1989|nr:glycosyltransferase family 4 protein [Microcoleus sp. FACHB-831]MBD1919777.1 glycosyltransferase family 4 protein [Microcoleus sp. FACHB-831]
MSECLVFLATAWGTRHGGINSFNYDLCKALAKLLAKLGHSDLKVVCIVDEGKKANEGQDAQESGVELLIVSPSDDLDSHIDNIRGRLLMSEMKPKWVIGHDVKTGLRAIELSKYYQVSVAVFHHMDYASYKSLQVKNDEHYVVSQREILSAAHTVFAVGPKLKELARDIVGEKISVIEVLPGLADIEAWITPSRFSAITFGRLEQENNLLKQTSLAVASFAQAVGTPGNSLNADAELTVIGFKGEEDEEYQLLNSIVEKYTDIHIPLHPWQYNQNRAKLFEHLRRQTVCMMLSIHDGFGLTGLEAISAEVPLILSMNTGLYVAVKNTLGGAGIGCLHPVEVRRPPQGQEYNDKSVEDVAKVLLKIAKHKAEEKENAKSLKKQLSELWTWENTARKLLKGLGYEGNNSADISDSDTLLQNKSTIETRSESTQTNSEIVLAEQKNSEGENQLPDTLKQDMPNLKIVANHPVRPKPEVPKFKKEIINLIQHIKYHLKSLDKSELKRILERDLPYPAMFDGIIKPTFIRDTLTTIRELSEQYSNSSQSVLLSEAYDLANRANRLLDICFQEILILKKASSRKSSLYTKKIDNVKQLFDQIEQQLSTLVSHLEEAVFQDIY